jgi:methylmalonyl-CoA mutase C-terminal domain/subunit
MDKERKVRVLMAKLGLDAHDSGAKIVSSWLRDAGFEVIYLGMFNTPEKIVKAALDEDVGIIGISSLSGEHLPVAEKLSELAREYKMERVKLIFGGVIPEEDIPRLKELGVSEVFGPGTLKETIIQAVKSLA